ncbi:MAG: hypothetical protein KRP56_07555 [Candidatus Methanogranum gryphiswaldense]|nr:MAG: hypothetical protein KRP56_07555 [Candidatus Methanogranum sp. U3.2.1]
MTKSRPYDEKDAKSVLNYAGKLTGHTLYEIGVIDLDKTGTPLHTKGFFGQYLEKGYFFIENNSSPEPDFIDIGIELKSTPMKKNSSGIVSKERLVLNIIDYMKLNELKFEGSFKRKNGDLLIVFYKWESNKNFYDLKILKVVHWRFPDDDLRIIEEDWRTIAKMVEEGRAEELSERFTIYLGACPKGSGHENDYRKQPFSNIKARQRALSLKSSYVNKIYRDSTLEECEGVFSWKEKKQEPLAMTSLFDGKKWAKNESFEQYVLDNFKKFIGKTCEEIEIELGVELNPASKSYRATLALRIMGVRTKHVREFEDADISMKTILLKDNNTPQESMSFPYFDYCKITQEFWETSEFHDDLDKKFFFIVFQKPKEKNNKNTLFKGAFFWSMPEKDLKEAEKVWNITKSMIENGKIDKFPGSRDNSVSHVRPHGRDSKDLCLAPDGNKYKKNCFWINRTYITKIVKESGILNSKTK